MTKAFLIFYNPEAGNGEAEKAAKTVQAHLKRRHRPTKEVIGKDGDDALEKLKAALPGAQGLISIGGDGSLNLAVTAMIQANISVPLGIIPNGTVNNFARSLNLPLNTDEAIENLLNGKMKKISVGRCNNQAVVSSCVFGTIADISNNVRQQEKRRFGPLIYVFKGLKGLIGRRSYKVVITENGTTKNYKIWSCLLTTTDYVGGRQYLPHNVKGFAVSILHNFSILKIPAYAIYIFTGKIKQLRGVTIFNTTEMTVDSRQKKPMYVRIDGDKGPKLPVKLIWLTDFLQVPVPQSKQLSKYRI